MGGEWGLRSSWRGGELHRNVRFYPSPVAIYAKFNRLELIDGTFHLCDESKMIRLEGRKTG